MEDGGFASFPKFESAPAAPPAAEQPQAVPAAQRPQTAPAAEQKVRVVGIKDAGEKKAAPAAAPAGGSVSSSWGGWGGGWLSSAASAMPQSTAALEGMTSMMSVTSMRASANAAAERLSAAMPVTAAAMDAMSPIDAASSLREKVSAALTVPSAAIGLPNPYPNPSPSPSASASASPSPSPDPNQVPSAAAIGLPAAPSVAKMPSLGGLTPNLGQAGGKLQAALKEAALPSMPSMPKHMPSFDPTQWAGLSSATSGDAGDEALAKTRTEAEHFAALLEAGLALNPSRTP